MESALPYFFKMGQALFVYFRSIETLILQKQLVDFCLLLQNTFIVTFYINVIQFYYI